MWNVYCGHNIDTIVQLGCRAPSPVYQKLIKFVVDSSCIHTPGKFVLTSCVGRPQILLETEITKNARPVMLQACSHCHVESSPQRKEMVSKEVAERCIEVRALRDVKVG